MNLLKQGFTGKIEKEYCDKCKGAKFFKSEDGEFIVKALCKCESQVRDEELKKKEPSDLYKRFSRRQVETIIKLSIMDDRYKNSYFGNLDLERPADFIDSKDRLKKYVIDFVKGKKHSAIIHGKVGRGKTELVACVHNHLKSKGVAVLLTSFMEIIKYITTSFNAGELEGQQFVENLLINIDLLILDDFGTEYVKGENSFSHNIIYNVINGRYMRNKPTIITTNDTSRELREKYAEKILDRIGEYRVKLSIVDGESYRLTKVLKD